MTLPAINEQLLRAVGVGVALFGGETLALRYANEIFERWFEGEKERDCAGLFPRLDAAAMLDATTRGERFTFEVHRRQRRRTLVLSLIFSQAEVSGEPLVILEVQNVTRIRELEAMLASYSTMVERNLAEVERERDALRTRVLELLPAGTREDGAGRLAVEADDLPAAGVLAVRLRRASDKGGAEAVLGELGAHHGALERIAAPLGCERVRVVGGLFLGVAAGPAEETLPALADVAAMFVRYLMRCNEAAEVAWTCAVGIDHGPAVAGSVGRRARFHDLVGPAVDGAMAASEAAAAMEVRLSARAHRLVVEGLALSHLLEAAADGRAILGLSRPVPS